MSSCLLQVVLIGSWLMSERRREFESFFEEGLGRGMTLKV